MAQFAAYISRGLCNPRLIFPRINRPNEIVDQSERWKYVAVTVERWIGKESKVTNMAGDKNTNKVGILRGRRYKIARKPLDPTVLYRK